MWFATNTIGHTSVSVVGSWVKLLSAKSNSRYSASSAQSSSFGPAAPTGRCQPATFQIRYVRKSNSRDLGSAVVSEMLSHARVI